MESTGILYGPAPADPQILTRQAAALAAAGARELLLVGVGWVVPDGLPLPCTALATDEPCGSAAWNQVLDRVRTPLLITLQAEACIELQPGTIERLAVAQADTSAPLVYSDHRARTRDGFSPQDVIDYQPGSIRDSFDFGPLRLWDTASIAGSPCGESRGAALYELRLRASRRGLPFRVPEPLYTALALDLRPTGARQFDYVDPRNVQAQQEREAVATAHLKAIDAYLPPTFAPPPADDAEYPVEASVIIPVRNRVKTIGDAVRAALEQKTDFAHNVIVVDNHSDDGTGELLVEMAAGDPRLVRLVPDRDDLGIGGCWDYAIRSPQAGRFAVQLDSDDVYAGDQTVAAMVGLLRDGPHVMVVGSYRLVDFDLNEIPPGLIDHREWTRENGHNNLLRVNGLGAPRAFRTGVLRRHPVPNVSYGEDYGIGLRLSRDYEIGRIYDPLYLCRRWGGNSDADLPLATKNRYDTYKDRLRTIEILARQQRNRT